MTTVFVSGSRRLSRINEAIRERVGNMIEQNFHIIVGDANGADKALQQFIADARYSNVTVFCSGDICRNNVGAWNKHHVAVDSKLKGRAFYTQKDKIMAAEADYGLVLWDGRSAGSISNVFELLKHGRTVVVYFAPEKQFFTIKSLDDAQALLKKCGAETVTALSRKISLPTDFTGVRNAGQRTLALS